MLTVLSSAPDDKSIGIEYCQKLVNKYRRYPEVFRRTKYMSILSTSTSTMSN